MNVIITSRETVDAFYIEISMLDWTPIPGVRLQEVETARFVEQFHQRYRICTLGRPDNIPTWCTFPFGTTTDDNIFSTPYFQSCDALYLYQENGKAVYRAAPYNIQEYFVERNPWETDWDFYILPFDLAWCITVTHELLHGCAIIVVGTFPIEAIP